MLSTTLDPENRLVARSLEHEWNEKLAQLEELEREYGIWSKHSIRPVSSQDRERILALALDLPTVWHAPTTTNTERKQLLRCLIRDVALTRCEKVIKITIRWQTGALTNLEVPRPRKSWEVRQTDARAVALIRQLAPNHTDRQIAARLNKEGLTAGLGGPFTHSKVGYIRWAYEITTECPEQPKACAGGQRGDGRFSVQKAAELLNVHVSTISEWCQEGRLESVRSAPMSPRWIKLTPETIAELRKPIRRRWSRTATTSAGKSASDYNKS